MGFHIGHIVHHIVHSVTHPIQQAVNHTVAKIPVVGQPIAHATGQIEKTVDKVAQKAEQYAFHPGDALHDIGREATNAYHAVGNAVEDVGQSIEHGINHLGHMMNQSPEVDQPEDYTTNAAVVSTPGKENADSDDNGESASAKKKAKAGGKKSLTVARSSGGGVNI